MDILGDRMKSYEAVEASRKLNDTLPVMVRLDGKAFHSWTKGLERPFCSWLSDAMIETTEFLINETGATIGYTQSDEISLVLVKPNENSQLWYDGKIQKITSVTAKFNAIVARQGVNRLACFDSRVWNVPSFSEASNTILWRFYDCVKNSVSMLASCHFSCKQLHGKNTDDKINMLNEIGVSWFDLLPQYRYGTLLLRKLKLVELSDEQLAKVPESKRPAGPIERHVIVKMPLDFRDLNNREYIFSELEGERHE